MLFLYVENEVALQHISLVIYTWIFLPGNARDPRNTKKLPKWVSETSEETRSYRSRLEWAELIVILIKIRGLPGPSRNAFASRLGRLPFASFPICITVKIPGITSLYMPRDALRAAVTWAISLTRCAYSVESDNESNQLPQHPFRDYDTTKILRCIVASLF